MKSLQTLQKTFRVFQGITKAAMILSFVWAGMAALGVACGQVWQRGGVVVGADQATLLALTKTGGLSEMISVLLAQSLFALTDGVLLAFACRYWRAEQADGTPFTQRGATQIQRLGVRTIVLPLVTRIVVVTLRAAFQLPSGGDVGDLPSVAMGVVLILASLVFRYGAELEEKKHAC